MKTNFKWLAVFLFTIWNIAAHAQNNGSGSETARSFLSVSGGIAFPGGNFASSDIDNEKAGFAKTGQYFALEGAWYFHKNIGIGGLFTTTSYALNTEALANRYLESFDCDSASAKAGPYRTVSFLIGPYFALPVSRLTFELRILGGITNAVSPDIIGTAVNMPNGPNEGSISTFAQTSATANTFGFQSGLAVKYAAAGHLLISLRGDYFYARPTLYFDNINRNNISGIILQSSSVAVSGINASFGIGYQF